MIIIGGGISGLYMAYKYHKKYPNDNITIIEKSSNVGGRIFTYNKYNIKYEIGAGRFSSSHKYLIQLIKEFNLYDNLIPITNTKKYIDKYDKKLVKNKFNSLLEKMNNKIKHKKGYKNKTIKELLETKEEFNLYSELVNHYEYYSEIEHYSAEFAYYIDNLIFSKSNFYILGGGLSELINLLEAEIKKYTKIIKSTTVTEINYSSNKFNLHTINNNKKKHIYETEQLCIAIPNNNIKNIKLSNNIKLSHITKLVTNEPLYRIYAKYPKNKNTGDVWFKDIGKVVTNSPIKYIIPIDSDNGIIMISYTDGKYAKKIKQNLISKNINDYIHTEINKLFENVPKPIWIRDYYWENGSHYWKGQSKEDILSLSQKIIKPFDNTNLFIIGETYSKYQAWIEGGLDTVESCISLL